MNRRGGYDFGVRTSDRSLHSVWGRTGPLLVQLTRAHRGVSRAYNGAKWLRYVRVRAKDFHAKKECDA